jgi:hypothetical protein
VVAAVAVAIACPTIATLATTLLAIMYRRRWQAYRCSFERMSAEHRQLYGQTLEALDTATEALAAAEAQWRQSLEHIQQGYDDNVEQLRIKQAAALVRLQVRLPQPRTHRLHGDERP